MELSPEQIAHLGRLARLHIAPAEQDRLQTDLNRILTYMERIAAADAGEVPVPETGDEQLRADLPGEGVSVDDALRGAPRSAGGFFLVPRFVDLTPRERPGPGQGGED